MAKVKTGIIDITRDHRHHQPGIHRGRSREPYQEQPLIDHHSQERAPQEAWNVFAFGQCGAPVDRERDDSEDSGTGPDPPASHAQRRDAARSKDEGAKHGKEPESHLGGGEGRVSRQDPALVGVKGVRGVHGAAI
jgi:hypothetical protein